MKVAYIVSLFPKVSETFILREMEALERLGTKIVVLSLKRQSETVVHPGAAKMIDRTIYPGSPMKALAGLLGQCVRRPAAMASIIWRLVATHLGHPVLLAKSLPVLAEACAACPRLKEAGVDRVHAHWATYPALAAWVIRKLEGIPYSITAHAHDIYLPNPHLREKILDSEFTVTISEFNRELLGKLCGSDAGRRVRVIHCGIPLDQFALRDAGPVPGIAARIATVGRLVDYKGFPTLLEALSLLQREGRDLGLDLIGEGPMRARLLAARDRLGLGESVRFLGSRTQEEVREILKASRAFVLASQRGADGQMDGIPVVLMEAMALGVPAVSTRISGIPELVHDGETGLLVEPGDPASLASAIGRILDEPGLSEEMARKGRQLIEREFDVDRSARGILGLMNGGALS